MHQNYQKIWKNYFLERLDTTWTISTYQNTQSYTDVFPVTKKVKDMVLGIGNIVKVEFFQLSLIPTDSSFKYYSLTTIFSMECRRNHSSVRLLWFFGFNDFRNIWLFVKGVHQVCTLVRSKVEEFEDFLSDFLL